MAECGCEDPVTELEQDESCLEDDDHEEVFMLDNVQIGDLTHAGHAHRKSDYFQIGRK